MHGAADEDFQEAVIYSCRALEISSSFWRIAESHFACSSPLNVRFWGKAGIVC